MLVPHVLDTATLAIEITRLQVELRRQLDEVEASRARIVAVKDRVLEVGEFLASAERVANGGSALDPQVVASLVSPLGGGPLARLSERERGVLGLMAQGLTNVGIAKRLVASERTVEAHVRHILLKLDIPEGEDDHRRVLAVLTHLQPRQ